jgi:hypothetical protein
MMTWLRLLLILAVMYSSAIAQTLTFQEQPGRVEILAEGKHLADYVYKDEKILRPYLSQVLTLDGQPVTRSLPPVEGIDKTDHATMHPGIWLAFGDLNGADFWRNKDKVRQQRFMTAPTPSSHGGEFEVENLYEAEGKTPCRESCRWTFHVRPDGYFILVDSTFTPEGDDLVFGDQEEMGLGVRVATPLTVENGGSILNSKELRNEKEAWGQQALWCHYSGTVNGRRAGILLIPHPRNIHPSWFHVRDYGLMVANPFGRKAFTGGEVSQITIKKGENLRLRWGLFVHSSSPEQPLDPLTIYHEYLGLLGFRDEW